MYCTGVWYWYMQCRMTVWVALASLSLAAALRVGSTTSEDSKSSAPDIQETIHESLFVVPDSTLLLDNAQKPAFEALYSMVDDNGWISASNMSGEDVTRARKWATTISNRTLQCSQPPKKWKFCDSVLQHESSLTSFDTNLRC